MIIYGTRYYFTSDKSVRNGVCGLCNRQAKLTSYTGTKFFHLYFIPLIPLGKNRVTDQCSACRRHYVQEFKKWEAARQQGIAGNLDKFRAAPTPEAAAMVHRGLLQFRDFERATEFRAEAERMFPGSAPMFAAFGEALEATQDNVQAQPYYQRALQLRSDLPKARIGVAKGSIASGQLDEARDLLNFLAAPGAAQHFDLSPLETLAYAYQKDGRHREALELFQILMTQLPNIGAMPNFQKAVKTSQTAVQKLGGVAHIDLPPVKKPSLSERFRPKGRLQPLLVLLGLVVLAITAFCVIRDYYVSYNRRLYIVNGFDKPATVSINDQNVTVQPNSSLLVELPEGKKIIKVLAPIQATYAFDLNYSSSFQRIADSDETIFNIDGEAIIELDRLHYINTNRPDLKIPNEYKFFAGQPFQVFQNIDYPFTPFPTQIDISTHDVDTVKNGLTIATESDYLTYLQNQNLTNDLLNFAENRLQKHPDNSDLLDIYVNNCTGSAEGIARLKAFLSLHLPFNPVSVPWHRQYQNYANTAEKIALRARYDQELLKYPNDSDLLYLRSRMAYTLKDAQFLILRSIQANPNNFWAQHSEAYVHRALGDFSGAEESERKAVNLSASSEFESTLIYTLIAENKTKDAEAELHSKLKTQPDDLELNESLMLCYSKEGNFDEVVHLQNRELNAIQNVSDSELPNKQLLISGLHITADYLTNNYSKLEKDTTPDAQPLPHFLALVAQKKWDQVQAGPFPDDLNSDAYSALLCSTAARADGQTDLADKLFTKCVTALQAQGDEKRLLVSILQSPTPPLATDLDTLNEDAENKGIILTALAYLHPELKKDYCTAAQIFHVVPSIDYFIIDPLISQK